MHLAKVITLSVLSIVSAVNISFAEQLAPPNIQDSKSFTGVDKSALKKEMMLKSVRLKTNIYFRYNSKFVINSEIICLLSSIIHSTQSAVLILW